MFLCLWAGKRSPYPFHILQFPRPGDTQSTNGLCLLDLPVTAQCGPGYPQGVPEWPVTYWLSSWAFSGALCSADLFYPRKLLLCVGQRPQCCLQFSRAACYPGLNYPASTLLVHVISQGCSLLCSSLGQPALLWSSRRQSKEVCVLCEKLLSCCQYF